MKKVYVYGICCGVHNMYESIGKIINQSREYELYDSVSSADLILLINTCVGNNYTIEKDFEIINNILKNKKEDTSVVVSGCLTKMNEFDSIQKKILSEVVLVKSDELLNYISRLLNVDLNIDIPYTSYDNSMKISIVDGCLNNCSFCKVNYADFSLKSIDLDTISKFATNMENSECGINHLLINSSNLSLYGVDLYDKKCAHEAIKILSKPSNLKFIELNYLINFYPELIDEILRNEKVKGLSVSLESGSDRIYKLMNRPISLDKLKDIIKLIRKERPDILINTEFICGFPTETLSDLNKTIDLLYELDINPMYINPFEDSQLIPAGKLKQHSYKYCTQLEKYSDRKVGRLRDKFIDFIEYGEMYVIERIEEFQVYKVLMIDGSIKYMNYNCFNSQYCAGDIIKEDTIKLNYLNRKNKVLKLK